MCKQSAASTDVGQNLMGQEARSFQGQRSSFRSMIFSSGQNQDHKSFHGIKICWESG